MDIRTMRQVRLPSGDAIPALGQGTWHLGEGRHPRAEEVAALRLGIELGMTLLDTAEMYGDGTSEELVGEAIDGIRDDVLVVTKVLPHHATFDGTIEACRASLARLKTERVDLYLLHWRGAVPLEETVRAFEELQRTGLIRHWGVSNFDLGDIGELLSVPGGRGLETDQVLYNLTRRGIEWDLLPWCQEHSLPIISYAPIEQGRLLGHPAIQVVAERHDATPAQIALAWVLRLEGVSTIPEAGTREHVRENREALDIRLTPEDLTELDRAFPPPNGPRPLEVL